ncbi:hypothetical protein ASPWEDRAFT_433578 [Aspergillus wentii DTO 134E9]|uniref:Uncharacterized protein n=1 Tax=Aspergillus wentii DTO 134E9 TaxID=1073089 RepID=A0A1L9RPZ4_ASPWE|nr:uncharacterized protein ASPWEDRAFT_433578 [Aspergillus wentii DTO 134E9]OJJ36888.1 hypothetical protein ASPWEDRAFT_433578 [Aspergillus wentii DTO 134E9]
MPEAPVAVFIACRLSFSHPQLSHPIIIVLVLCLPTLSLCRFFFLSFFLPLFFFFLFSFPSTLLLPLVSSLTAPDARPPSRLVLTPDHPFQSPPSPSRCCPALSIIIPIPISTLVLAGSTRRLRVSCL